LTGTKTTQITGVLLTRPSSKCFDSNNFSVSLPALSSQT
jgi:hypothetical protein